MQGITTYRLEGHRAQSWNDFYSGKHYRVRMAEKNQIVQLVRTVLTGDEVPYTEPVDVVFKAYMTGNLTDADNVCPKYYIDALVHWRVLADDSPMWVSSYHSYPVRAKEPALVIMLIPTTLRTNLISQLGMALALTEEKPQWNVSVSLDTIENMLQVLGE